MMYNSSEPGQGKEGTQAWRLGSPGTNLVISEALRQDVQHCGSEKITAGK